MDKEFFSRSWFFYSVCRKLTWNDVKTASSVPKINFRSRGTPPKWGILGSRKPDRSSSLLWWREACGRDDVLCLHEAGIIIITDIIQLTLQLSKYIKIQLKISTIIEFSYFEMGTLHYSTNHSNRESGGQFRLTRDVIDFKNLLGEKTGNYYLLKWSKINGSFTILKKISLTAKWLFLWGQTCRWIMCWDWVQFYDEKFSKALMLWLIGIDLMDSSLWWADMIAFPSGRWYLFICLVFCAPLDSSSLLLFYTGRILGNDGLSKSNVSCLCCWARISHIKSVARSCNQNSFTFNKWGVWVMQQMKKHSNLNLRPKTYIVKFKNIKLGYFWFHWSWSI